MNKSKESFISNSNCPEGFSFECGYWCQHHSCHGCEFDNHSDICNHCYDCNVCKYKVDCPKNNEVNYKIMKHLKIMVKETAEERITLTRRQRLLFHLYNNPVGLCKHDEEYVNKKVKELGYVHGSYQHEKYTDSILIRTETIREATLIEKCAYHMKSLIELGCTISCCKCSQELGYCDPDEILAGKEVYPELVEE